MADEVFYGQLPQEEIEAAPALQSAAEIREERLSDKVELNRWLLQQARQMQCMLLEAADLQALLEVLLVSMPRHFGFRVAELWLYDPEHVLAGLITSGHRYGQYLQLHHDVFEMQELYDLEPENMLLDATDSRMFEVLKADQGIQHALLVPLLDSGRLMGSYHCGFSETPMATTEDDERLIAHLAAVVSISFKNAVSRQQISRLTMLDPLTQISNLRGFEKDIAREIARARRADEPLSVLMLEIDEFDELFEHYGEITGRFVLKKVTERVSSGLRATDLLARLSDLRLAALLTGTGEAPASDVAERIRKDIEGFLIDDGRGAVMQVTLSLGLVTWEPHQYPAVDMAQLAKQMQTVGANAVHAATASNGNQLKLGRLSTLMV
ncbi:sensor domain-containing diguanylate cyclase [Haliea sp. E1-2-M8]|uniref:sensor domain-containing diguanylate cyclase n=1 Tax=Haliea sp. E1-2-M8 TaxID=3064706 RepID=UPI00272164C1|nr:sensor domain-containing diguanylate cyclase [Haliea sp. E1-2-M8]MDO8861432.1 sensor domain-containing diguanylate cyclase [Haliea sp. E1-2-M8]